MRSVDVLGPGYKLSLYGRCGCPWVVRVPGERHIGNPFFIFLREKTYVFCVDDSRALTGDEGQNDPLDAVFLSVENTVTLRNIQKVREYGMLEERVSRLCL